MSGVFRRVLGLSTKRLSTTIAKYDETFKNLELEELDEDEVVFYLEKAQLLRKQLDDNNQKIHDVNEKWIRFIEQKESSKEQEQTIYDDFCDKHQNNFIEAAENATDAIDNLDLLIVELSQATRQQKKGFVTETNHPQQPIKPNFQLTAKLNHPTFDGNIEFWPTFSETFKVAIHNNNQYTEIEKLSYLLSYLKGEAAESVVGYPIVAASYKLVWSMLEERFGDRDCLIHKMLAELRNLQPCKNSSQQELRRVYSTIARTTRCMTSFDVDCDNDQTIAIIEEKIPKTLLRELYIAKANLGLKKWSVERLIKEFDNIIKLNEKIESMRPSNNYTVTNKPSTHQQPTKSAVSSMYNKPRSPCILCNGEHWNSECTTYPDSNSRANRLREENRCFTCLQKGHTSRNCEKQIVCKKCSRKHSTLICRSSDSRLHQNSYEVISYPKQHDKQTPTITHQSKLTGGNAVAIRQTTLAAQQTTIKKNGHLLSSIITLIKDDGRTKDVAALIDTCSTITLISDKLFKECGIEILKNKQAQASQLAIRTIGDQIAYYDNKWGTIELATTDQNRIKMTAQIIPNLMKTIDIIVANGKGGTSTIETKAELLIGADYLYDIITDKPMKLDNNVFKLETILGTAYGGGHSEKVITAILKKDDAPEKQDTNPIHWALDDISTTKKNDDETARSLFNKHITQDLETGRYTTKWLFKQNPTTLPTNIEVAYARLKSTLRGLKKSAMPNALEEYDAQIKAELAAGTTELVQEDNPTGANIHYLCHHPVYKREHRTHKIRIVYDASAKTRDGSCLNDYMYRGPINLPSIPGCILRFRSTKIGMVADVQKAFHQVGLSPKDRDFTRFLWIKDIKKPITSENIEIYRFTSLVFGVITSPSLLGMTIDAHLKNHRHPLAAELRKDIYVDNVTLHVDSISDGIEKFKNSRKIFADANMNLREFMSNNQELNNYLMTQDNYEIPKLTKFPGVPWSLETDELCFPLPVPPKNTAQTTMRKVLEHVAKAYDICGLNAPALLKPKLFFQKLSYSKNGKFAWDEALHHDDIKEWEKILNEWHGSSKHPRYLQALAAQEFDLHVFTDASKAAICAAAYIIDTEGNSNIILAQQRLASCRNHRTIPDLEVAAILEGAKLIKFLRKEFTPFKDKMVTLYSDSKIALSYVKNGRADGVFANNRVKAIRGVPKITYQYVHTKSNPADIGTRGCTMAELNKNDMWNYGPKLIMQLPQPEPFYVSSETPIVFHPVVCTIKDQKITSSTTNCLIDVSRYSTWEKAVRITMKVIEWTYRLRSKEESSSKLHDRAIILLISESQTRHAPSTTEIKQYNMFQDNVGLWRCKSRFSSSAEIEAHPIYLPKHDSCTKLLILYEHEKQLHAGVNQTLTNMQQNFWYPQYRKTTKAVLRSCMPCRKLNAVPYSLPPMGNLPDDRTRFSIPFNNCGIDYLGPFTVRTTTGDTTKTWIALFTCLAVRAVHLEIVPDLTAKSFLQCLRRFISRRGCLKTLISDNASTFKLANDVLKEADKRKLLEYKIIWRNIPALSPWKGGVYERLVGIVKTASKAAIGKRIVDIHCFHTTVCEMEATVNRRPLVYAAGDEPGFKALTPADFLMPTKRSTLLLNNNDEDFGNDSEWKPVEVPAEKLLDHWRKTNLILDKFKKRFKQEYLPMLRERSRQLRHHGRHLEARITPKTGQIVLLRDLDNTFSNDPSKWPIGIITELHNHNGNAVLKMGNGKTLQRPINMLYPIELQTTESKSTAAGINTAKAASSKPKGTQM